MTKPIDSLRDAQFAFAGYIRDPQSVPVPFGLDPERMAIYRELFFNNIENCLGNAFPVLKAILAGIRWQELVNDFYAHHRCRTPIFVEVAEEFLVYLSEERGESRSDPSFILELAHYEWVELALAISEGEEATPLAGDRGYLDQTLRVSDLACPLSYRFPVHCIGPDMQPDQAPDVPTFLVVYRDPHEDVRFLEINGVTYRWLHILEELGPTPGRESFQQLALELAHPDVDTLLHFGESLIRDLANRGILGAALPAS